jgi:hypothetical protein
LHLKLKNFEQFASAGQRTYVLLTLLIPAVGSLLSNRCCRCVRGSCDRMDVGWPTENLSLWRGAFQPTSFDPAVGRYRPNFEIRYRVNKIRQRKRYARDNSEVSRLRAGCVCSGGISSDSTTIKDAVFRNSDLSYLPCCLHPPARYSL